MSVVIPFPRRSARAPGAVAIHCRRDLRTGVTASGLARATDANEPPVETLLNARVLWRDAGQSSPLALPIAPETYADAAAAGALCASIEAAGFSPRSVDLEVDEAALAPGADLSSLARMRARGFGVVLRAAPGCELPLGREARSLFTEIVVSAPSRLDPFMAADPSLSPPVVRRVFAARAAGIPVTAVGIADRAWAMALANVGFDRSEDVAAL